MDQDIPLISALSPSQRPEVISNVTGYNDETKVASCNAYDMFKSTYANGIKIHNLAADLKDNPALTQPEKTLKIADLAAKHFATAEAAFNSCVKNLENSITHFEKTLSAPLKPKSPRGHEIRNHVNNLSKIDRATFIKNAIENGKHEIIAELLGGESFLIGLSDGESKMYRNKYHKLNDPLTSDRLAVAKSTLKLVVNRSTLLTAFFESAMGLSVRDIQKVRSAKALADKAFRAAS